MKDKKKKGQSLAEYAIVAGLIAVVLAAMGPGFRRSIQQVMKSVADVIGFQAGAEQAAEPDKGFLNSLITHANTTVTKETIERAGVYRSTETQHTNMESATLVNGATYQQ